MAHQLGIKVGRVRQGEFEHHRLCRWLLIELSQQRLMQQHLGCGFFGALDIDLGFNDRHQTMANDLASNRKLLGHHGIDARLIRQFDDRTHFGAKNTFLDGTLQQRIEFGHGLHHLHTVMFVGKTLVDFQKWDDLLFGPQKLGTTETVDVAIHRAFKQNCTQHTITLKRLALHHAATHCVHCIKHLHLTRVFGFTHTVERQRFGCAATTLVESSDETFTATHAFKLLRVWGHEFLLTAKNSVAV